MSGLIGSTFTPPVRLVPARSVTKSVRKVWSLAARRIFRRCPQVKKHLWGGEIRVDGCFASAVGKHGDEKVIGEYVRKQGQQYYKRHSDHQLALLIPRSLRRSSSWNQARLPKSDNRGPQISSLWSSFNLPALACAVANLPAPACAVVPRNREHAGWFGLRQSSPLRAGWIFHSDY